MTDTVKAKVAEHHFKGQINIAGTTLVKSEAREVEPNITLRNMESAGNVIVTEGDLTPEKNEKSFREDDGAGEESESDDEPQEEPEEVEEEQEAESLEDLTVDELRERCEEQGLKKSGNKEELIERLKNEGEE